MFRLSDSFKYPVLSGLFFVFFCCSISLSSPRSAFSESGYSLEISKSERLLVLLQSGQPIKSYPISIGSGGKGQKKHIGDKKTPNGYYKVINIKDSERFYRFIQIDYPDPTDAWHGYLEQLIDGAQFRSIAVAWKNNELPMQTTRLGGYIGIHGIGEVTKKKLAIHRAVNWTGGCIALTNEEMDELVRFVKIGTPVAIYE